MRDGSDRQWVNVVPRPKPTALLVLHGDRKDWINDTEPAAPTREITCPDWVSEQARMTGSASPPA